MTLQRTRHPDRACRPMVAEAGFEPASSAYGADQAATPILREIKSLPDTGRASAKERKER